VHLLLVDRLTCPRCGPAFGLVLLADRVSDRRVLEGWLGCPNCRDRFRVSGGFGDLRAPPRDELPATSSPSSTPAAEETMRLAAFLGVAEGPVHVALLGSVAVHAHALAGLISELEVAAVSAAGREEGERVGVSRMVSAPGLAFQTNALRGVALAGDAPEGLVQEAARVVGPSGRVVMFGAPTGSAERLRELGLHPLLDQGGVLVAEKAGPRPPSTGIKLPIVG
jgi:hypothetical protein